MCSALLSVTAVNDQRSGTGSLAKLFSDHIQRFDSEAEDSVQHSCNLIVKGLLLTCAVFPRFKVPTPLQWDARHSATRVMLRLTVQRKLAAQGFFLLAGLAEGELIAEGCREHDVNLPLRIRHIILASGGRVVRFRYRR